MQLIESHIVPFSLAIGSGPPRVPASSVLASNALSGFPGLAHLSRVGDEAAGCPAPSVHGLCRRWNLEYPRSSHASALPVSSVRQVAPRRRFLLCKRLRYSSQVAPRSVPSGSAGDGIPSRPGTLILRRCRLADPRVAPLPGLSVSPMIRFGELPRVANLPATSGVQPGCPEPYTLRFCLAAAASGCPSSASACRISGLIRELPRFTCC